MDNVANFAIGQITSAPSPADSGTTFTVSNDSLFPDPSTFGQYYLVVWPENVEARANNAEIVRVVGKSSSTLTVVRGEQDTDPISIALGYNISMNITKGLWDQLIEAINLKTPENGWILVSPAVEPWVRTGNHTFIVTGGAGLINKYRPGTKVSYNDGGVDFGVIGTSVVSGSDLNITLIQNSDFSMAATTITAPRISYIENPEGFPQWFNYTINFGVNGTIDLVSISDADFKWQAKERTIKLFVYMNTGTTSGSSNSVISMGIPVNAAGRVGGACKVRDGATINIITGWWEVEAGLASIGVGTGISGATTWGIGTGRHINGVFEYRF